MKERQTSVDWLFHKLWDTPKDKLTWYAILEQASIMHKEEIVEAFDYGDYCIDLPGGEWEQNYKSAEQYYNEKFNDELESQNLRQKV